MNKRFMAFIGWENKRDARLPLKQLFTQDQMTTKLAICEAEGEGQINLFLVKHNRTPYLIDFCQKINDWSINKVSIREINSNSN